MDKKIFIIAFIIIIMCFIIPVKSFATYSSIYPEPSITLKRGTYGNGVKWLQDMLNHNGYTLSIDGEFGNATYNAVTNFQKNNNLQVDGIVGPATKSMLKNMASISSMTYKYTTTRVNIRSGPSTSYNSYGVLNINTKISEINSQNGWSYVKYNNTYGYINSKYLSFNQTLQIPSSNNLTSFSRNSSSLIQIIKNCKSYLANNNFYYSTANGVRTIPMDKSTSYSGKYYVDCSSFVSWALYEYARANGNLLMQNYFNYQRNSATFAQIGANGGNNYLSVVSAKGNSKVNLELAKPGDILVSNGHVEFFNSYTKCSNTYVNIKVYNCGSNTSINSPGITTSATLNPADITYILRVK